MSRQPRFEVVRSDAGWFARFIATNGREVWRTSENYVRLKAAARAIELVTQALVYDVQGSLWLTQRLRTVEVRRVDERTPKP